MNDRYEILNRYNDDQKGEMIRIRFPDGKVHEYYYCTMDDVCKMLEKDEKIKLNCCYIKDFDYAELCGEESDSKPELIDFSARISFFDGKTSFKGATFSGETNFRGATFSGNANFRGATFSSVAYFWDATFSGVANFGKATFSGDAHFWDATFSGQANFMGVAFSGDADLGGATFSGKANFSEIKGNGQLHFRGCNFKDQISFNKISCDTLIFDNCTNDRLIDMKEVPKKIGGLAFKNLRNLGHINLNWSAYKDALKAKVDLKDPKAEDYHANQFKMLKENFHNLGDYDAEDEACVEFKRFQRKERRGLRRFISFF